MERIRGRGQKGLGEGRRRKGKGRRRWVGAGGLYVHSELKGGDGHLFEWRVVLVKFSQDCHLLLTKLFTVGKRRKKVKQ